MGDAGINILCSLIASLIYDIGKVCAGKYTLKKDEFTIEKIAKYVNEELDDKYSVLMESGVFMSFIKTPCFNDLIDYYIIYKVTGNCRGTLVKLKKGNKKIAEKDIIEYLTEKLKNSYSCEITTIPSKTLIRQFFSEIFKISADYIFEYLSVKEKASIYFVNNKIDVVQETLLHRMDETIETIKRTMECECISVKKDYKEILIEYHKILKQNHSKAHVYLLDTFEFSTFYVAPILRYLSKKSQYDEYIMMRDAEIYEYRMEKDMNMGFNDWKYIFQQNNIVYITGGAGYGKSLFMKKVINDYFDMNILNSSDYLVVYGELKSFYKDGREQPISIPQFIQDSMITETLMDKGKISIDLIEDYLKMGRCLILFDALDEVPKEKRNNLHKKVVNYFKTHNPNNKVCITSRNRGFIPEKQVEVYDIAPLNGNQIEMYVDRIIKLGKFAEEDKETFLKQTSVLVSKGFLNSFLILSLLINIYKAERELPENKIELYQKCFEYIANKREKEKTQGKYDWNLISPLMKDNTFMELAHLCFPNNSDIGKTEIEDLLCDIYKGKYTSLAETERAVDNFLEFCSERTELFVPAAGEDRFKFFHRSFFEYFYSQYIFLRIRETEDIYKMLCQFDVDSEVFELTFAMLKQKDEYRYQELLEYIFKEMQNEIQSKSVVALNIMLLGMQAVDDELYKKMLVEFLAKNRDFISKNIDKISNDWIVDEVVSDNKEYTKIIIEAYTPYALLYLANCYLRKFNERLVYYTINN